MPPPFNLPPGRSLVTGDRSLTRNPSGRAGLPLAPMSEQIGSRGMTDQRRSEMAGRRLSSAMRAGDMQATALLYRGPTGYGRGFDQPPGRGYLPPVQRPDSLMPPPAPAAPQAPAMPALPPPMSAEQALGMPNYGAPGEGKNSQAQQPPMPQRMPWEGQPLPGGMPMGQLPPSTLMGGAGLPPPPRFSEVPAGGMNMIVDNETGKQVAAFKRESAPSIEMTQVPNTSFRVPTLGGTPVAGLPTFQEQPLDAPPVGGMGPTRIQSVSEGDVKTNVQWNAAKNRWERVKIYNPGDPDDNGIPGDQRPVDTATPGAAWRGLGGR